MFGEAMGIRLPERRYSPRQLAALALALGAGAAVPLMIWGLRFHVEGNPTLERWNANPLPARWVVLCSLSLGLGLGILGALFWLNRNRLRVVFRPSSRRVVLAGAIMLVTPIGQFFLIPLSTAYLFALSLERVAYDPGNPERLLQLAFVSAIFVAGTAAWYGAIGLIVSGVRRRWVRATLGAALWSAVYCGLMLAAGLAPKSL